MFNLVTPTVDFLDTLENVDLMPRDRIIKLIGIMKDSGCADGAMLPLDHQFAPGTYSRTIFMPQGSLVIGKIHKNACINIISMGGVKVWTEHGQVERWAPAVWVSEPGTQRVVQNLTDVVWTTVHQNPDNTTDLEVLESQVILPDYSTIPIIEVEALQEKL